MEYNKEHGIVPKTIVKAVRDQISAFNIPTTHERKPVDVIKIDDIPTYIQKLEKEMKRAAKDLDFETAAMLRDRIVDLKKMKN